MVSPTFQSTSSEVVNVFAPFSIVAEIVVQVGIRFYPCMVNLHSMHPIPLLPNIGSCLP